MFGLSPVEPVPEEEEEEQEEDITSICSGSRGGGQGSGGAYLPNYCTPPLVEIYECVSPLITVITCRRGPISGLFWRRRRRLWRGV